jgi:hypothetical protein
VEAFFLVHASAIDKEEKKTISRESREAQLAHLDLPPVSPIQAGDPRTMQALREDAEMFEPCNSTMLETSVSSSSNLSPDTQKFLKFAGKCIVTKYVSLTFLGLLFVSKVPSHLLW